MTILPIFLLLLAQAADSCGPKPPPPPQSEAWAVQDLELLWRTEVPGWILDECWMLGRVDLIYENDADEGKPVQEPGPWIVGDWPAGEPCPAEAVAGCWDVVDGELVRVP